MFAISAHRRARIVLMAAVVLLTGWFLAPVAAAHDVLIDSSPADGEVLTESPESVTLTFNNPPMEVGSVIVLEDADGATVVEEEGTVEGTEVRLELVEPLPNGDYTVAWRVASSDGHPIEGRIPFTVEAEEPEPTEEPTTEEPTTEAPATAEPTEEEPTTEAAPTEPETTDAASDDAATEDDGGLPTWGFVLIAIAVLGAIAAIITTLVRRQRAEQDDPSV